MKKLKAFSYMDTLVGTVIGSMIIGFAVVMYVLFFKNFNAFDRIGKKNNEIRMIKTMLNKDFFISEKIFFTENSVNFSLFNGDSIIYNFGSEFIAKRQKSVTDTFHVHVTNIKTGFSLIGNNSSPKLIDEMSFEVFDRNKQYSFSFFKQYGADIYIELEDALKNTNTIIKEKS